MLRHRRLPVRQQRVPGSPLQAQQVQQEQQLPEPQQQGPEQQEQPVPVRRQKHRQ